MSAADTMDALLDYLAGQWRTCDHQAIGVPGCPTCEGRWSRRVQRIVQSHRDRTDRAVAEAVAEVSSGRVREAEATEAAIRRTFGRAARALRAHGASDAVIGDVLGVPAVLVHALVELE